jgi:dihydroxyacetone kinase-like predicted kinase
LTTKRRIRSRIFGEQSRCRLRDEEGVDDGRDGGSDCGSSPEIGRRHDAEVDFSHRHPIQDYKKQEDTMLKYRYDTQLLIDGENLSDDRINEYISQNIEGDCLLAIGDEDLIKIHFHTNTPWKVLEYCASLGEIYDIVIEDMERQSHGLKG